MKKQRERGVKEQNNLAIRMFGRDGVGVDFGD